MIYGASLTIRLTLAKLDRLREEEAVCMGGRPMAERPDCGGSGSRLRGVPRLAPALCARVAARALRRSDPAAPCGLRLPEDWRVRILEETGEVEAPAALVEGRRSHLEARAARARCWWTACFPGRICQPSGSCRRGQAE